VSVITAVAALALFFWTPSIGYAIDKSEYEYEYYEGLHEEEWYDPTDWFNEDEEQGINYETDWYDSTYGYDDSAYGYNDDSNTFYNPGYYDYYDYYNDYDGFGYPDYNYNYYTDDWYDDGIF